MAYAILRYPLTNDMTQLDLPLGAKVISAHAQDNRPFIWAVVDTEETRTTSRTFTSLVTGRHFVPTERDFNFIGTVMLHDDAFVIHIFELEPRVKEGG